MQSDYTVKTRRFKCLLCGTLAESSRNHPRDSAYCRCRAVWIDGGISAGATLTGDPSQMEDLSLYQAQDGTVLLAVEYHRLKRK